VVPADSPRTHCREQDAVREVATTERACQPSQVNVRHHRSSTTTAAAATGRTPRSSPTTPSARDGVQPGEFGAARGREGRGGRSAVHPGFASQLERLSEVEAAIPLLQASLSRCAAAPGSFGAGDRAHDAIGSARRQQIGGGAGRHNTADGGTKVVTNGFKRPRDPEHNSGRWRGPGPSQGGALTGCRGEASTGTTTRP